MAVFGLGRQGRVLVAQLGETERNGWIVGSCGVRNDNEIHLIDFDEDHDEISHTSFSHPNEVCHIAPSPSKADIFFSCARQYDSGRLRSNGNGHDRLGELDHVARLDPVDGLGHINQVLWDPSGDTSQIVAIGQQSIAVYGLASGTLAPSAGSLIRLRVPESPSPVSATCAAWNPHNDPQVAVGFGRALQIWDIRSSNDHISIPKAHELSIRSVDYNPNKPYHVVTAGEDCRIRVWDTRHTSQPLKEICDHTHWIWCVTFNRSHDQLLLSSSSDCQVNLQSVVSVSSARFHSGGIGTTTSHEVPDRLSLGRRVSRSIGSPSVNVPGDDGDRNDDVDAYQSKTADGLIASFDQHEESVYSVAWSSADPWIFASLSYDGRVVVNQVPRDHKYKIIL